MLEAKFELSEIASDPEWDRLVSSSPQGTVFSSSMYLKALALPFRRFVVTEGGRVVGLCCAPEDATGSRLVAPDFTPYQGILFAGAQRQLDRQRIVDEFRITEFLITELAKRYNSIRMRLSWMFEDIRPFQWHNYHGPAGGRFRLTPAYTATLNLSGVDEATVLANIRTSRRQEARKARDLRLSDNASVDEFIDLYKRTFLRQDIQVSEETIALVGRICRSAIDAQVGRLSACYVDEGPVSMNLFLFDQRRAYYLFGANSPDLRATGGSTRLILDSILNARSRGLEEIDFVGVNSPQRGDFKLSFNPTLRLHFLVECGD